MTSFRSVVLLTVTIESLMLQMVYGGPSKGGLALFDLLCFTSAPFGVGANFHACFRWSPDPSSGHLSFC